MELFYLYVLYSSSADRYYVGYSSDPWRRLLEHNNTPFNTYTSKHRPWVIKVIFSVESKSIAITAERFIKKQKDRDLIERLIDPEFVPSGKLAQLVRVPDIRD